MDSSDEEKQLQARIAAAQQDEVITGARLDRHIHKLLQNEQSLTNKPKLSTDQYTDKHKALLQQLNSTDSKYENDMIEYRKQLDAERQKRLNQGGQSLVAKMLSEKSKDKHSKSHKHKKHKKSHKHKKHKYSSSSSSDYSSSSGSSSDNQERQRQREYRRKHSKKESKHKRRSRSPTRATDNKTVDNK